MSPAKTVVLGVTGSIAAYKAPMVASALKKRNVEVYPVMTEAAVRFITPLTLETVCAHPAANDLFSRETPWEVEHIALAKRADVFLIAPATANCIAKLAAGIADDMLTSTVLATKAPVMVAPAMNTNMWDNPATQGNIALLEKRGVTFIQPDTGPLACGDTGAGRLAEIDAIVEAVLARLEQKEDLAGLRFLISAGPTREAIDPVRFISNRSSGKMGYALAKAAAERGAKVTLVSGPVALNTPYGVERVDVTSADEMLRAVKANLPEADVLIMAAAVADYAPEAINAQKLKKAESMTLELKRTDDILLEVAPLKAKRIHVGFAAETQELERYALDKLARKSLDMVVANDVSRPGVGFDGDTNAVTIFNTGGSRKELPLGSKAEIAAGILDEIVKLVSH